MKDLNRRHLLTLAGAGVASLSAAGLARAQSAAPLRLVVGFPPGGAADILSRALAERLRAHLGTTVVVDNRPGAGGRIAAEQIKGAPADGSTVLVSPASVVTMAPYIYRNVRYELGRDFTPVTSLARLDLALYAGPGVPDSVKGVDALLKWIQANPKSNSCGVPGLGSTPHLAALMLGRFSKLDWQIVPYQGDAPTFTALLGGEIPIAVSSLAGGMEHVRSGKLRLVATAGSRRSSFMPNVPNLAESGFPEVVVEDRHSVFVPKQTPATVVTRLNESFRSALQSPLVADTLQRLALERAGESADEFAQVLKGDAERWGPIVKALNIAME